MTKLPKHFDKPIERIAIVSVLILFGCFLLIFAPVVYASYLIWPDDSGDRMYLNMPAAFASAYLARYLADKYKDYASVRLGARIAQNPKTCLKEQKPNSPDPVKGDQHDRETRSIDEGH